MSCDRVLPSSEAACSAAFFTEGSTLTDIAAALAIQNSSKMCADCT